MHLMWQKRCCSLYWRRFNKRFNPRGISKLSWMLDSLFQICITCRYVIAYHSDFRCHKKHEAILAATDVNIKFSAALTSSLQIFYLKSLKEEQMECIWRFSATSGPPTGFHKRRQLPIDSESDKIASPNGVCQSRGVYTEALSRKSKEDGL